MDFLQSYDYDHHRAEGKEGNIPQTSLHWEIPGYAVMDREDVQDFNTEILLDHFDSFFNTRIKNNDGSKSETKYRDNKLFHLSSRDGTNLSSYSRFLNNKNIIVLIFFQDSDKLSHKNSSFKNKYLYSNPEYEDYAWDIKNNTCMLSDSFSNEIFCELFYIYNEKKKPYYSKIKLNKELIQKFEQKINELYNRKKNMTK